ncbi:unnamed protein product [Durusdinium trenchii]|uniref:Retrotransposon gag domain-containing protein n=1 Tax=Durusdinium trenchii TaxID=1381693 RepID=A0ABP0NCU7_9DINO
MPTPGEEDSVQEADLDDEGAFPAGPEEMRPGTPTERSWGGWSEQEPTTPGPRHREIWGWIRGWCKGSISIGTYSLGGTYGGAGGQDKIQVPEYNGEDDRDGLKAKGYIRKIEAWRRVTRLTRPKQALMLYNNLTGRAWRDAEELELGLLDSEQGVEVFVDWIKSRYMDREVTKIGRYMSDFFKVLKRNTQQDIRDFNQEFDRQVSRLKEVGRALPDACLAWWYVDKMRMDNTSELNLLSSVGNSYTLKKLQDAAIIQDRMNRRMWERRPDGDRRSEDRRTDDKKKHQALMTSIDENHEEIHDSEDTMTDDEDRPMWLSKTPRASIVPS